MTYDEKDVERLVKAVNDYEPSLFGGYIFSCDPKRQALIEDITKALAPFRKPEQPEKVVHIPNREDAVDLMKLWATMVALEAKFDARIDALAERVK